MTSVLVLLPLAEILQWLKCEATCGTGAEGTEHISPLHSPLLIHGDAWGLSLGTGKLHRQAKL